MITIFDVLNAIQYKNLFYMYIILIQELHKKQILLLKSMIYAFLNSLFNLFVTKIF